MKTNALIMWILTCTVLLSPTAWSKAHKRQKSPKSNEKCYSRLSEMPAKVRPIFDAYLQSKSKPSFWGPVVTFGKPKQKVRDIEGLCLLSDPNGCGWKQSNEPTQILIGKKSGTFQILRDWNQDPKSRRANAYRLLVCADPEKVFPIHLRFTVPKWVGDIKFVTTIAPNEEWNKTPNKKVLKISTSVRKDQGPRALYSQSKLDIQPMINEYMMASQQRPASPSQTTSNAASVARAAQ